MEIKSILIKDTTREERIRIIQEGLNQCGGACDFCNGCDNLGGGSVDTFYEPYINGEKELRQLNEEYRNKHYYVRTSCCNTLYELDPEMGKAIARGEQVLIRPEHLQRISKVTYGYNYKHCNYCGYETAENFEYCPKCGKKF